MAAQKFKYACVTCFECCELMALFAVVPGHAFQLFDPGPSRCTKNHLRIYQSKDVQILEFDQPRRIAPSS